MSATHRVGDAVKVLHIGLVKTGRITWVGRTNVKVEVTCGAKTNRPYQKVITRAISELL